MTQASDAPSPQPGESVDSYRARLSAYVDARASEVLAEFERLGLRPPEWMEAVARLRSESGASGN